MSETTPEVTVYFDESGFTGEDLRHPVQRNLVLAGVAIPAGKTEFWSSIWLAWARAASTLHVAPDTVELKGSQLYGGWGLFKGICLEERVAVIDSVIECLVRHRIDIFWDGLPKHRWLAKMSRLAPAEQPPFWKAVLIAFCTELHDVASAVYGRRRLRIIGDENSCAEADSRLTIDVPGKWGCLHDGGVLFMSSSETPGLQVADMVVHTLYRANKVQVPDPSLQPPRLSKFDRIAAAYHARLSEAGLLINLTHARGLIE